LRKKGLKNKMYPKEANHFLFLHFPIAIFITGYIFHILYTIKNEDIYKTFFTWMIGMGIIWSVFSIITGYITAFDNSRMESISDIFTKNHSNLMLLSSLFFFCIYFLRDKNNNALFFFHTIAIILLIYGSHLGAKWTDRI